MDPAKLLKAKQKVESGQFKTISELLEILNKTPLSRAVKSTPERWNRLLADLSRVTLGDIHDVAKLLNTDDSYIYNLFHTEFLLNLKKKKK